MIERVGKPKAAHAFGNAVSISVLERILCRLLLAGNLVSEPLRDVWETMPPLPVDLKARDILCHVGAKTAHSHAKDWVHTALSRGGRGLSSGS